MTRGRTRPAPAADPRDEWLRLDRQLCFALYSSSLAMTQIYKPLLAALGLTYPQYLVMLVLWEAEGLSVSQLGQRLSLDSGTLTPLLKRLESLGHIERRRASDDERRVDIFLTPAGRKLRLKGRGIPGAQPGDLYLILDVVLPPANNERARELYQAMARDLAFNPRTA